MQCQGMATLEPRPGKPQQMGDLGLLFAVVIAAYIVGVWTGALVFKQRQRAYEEAVTAEIDGPPVILVRRRPEIRD